MKTLLFSLLLFFTSLNSSEPVKIFFKEASLQEVPEIEEHLLSFYVQQLFDAGLFENLDEAGKAARTEWNEDASSNPNKKFYCYLVSNEELKQCGYLVYSVSGFTATRHWHCSSVCSACRSKETAI